MHYFFSYAKRIFTYFCTLTRCVFSGADLVLYCEAFLTTYRTFLTPEDLIKKLHYRYPFTVAWKCSKRMKCTSVCAFCFFLTGNKDLFSCDSCEELYFFALNHSTHILGFLTVQITLRSESARTLSLCWCVSWTSFGEWLINAIRSLKHVFDLVPLNSLLFSW